MGKWDEMKAAYENAPEGTAVVLWRSFKGNPWTPVDDPSWYAFEEYRLLLNVTEWQPPTAMYQSRVKIPRPLTTLEGRDGAWLTDPTTGGTYVLFSWLQSKYLNEFLRAGLLYADEEACKERIAAMLVVEEA